MNGLMEGQRGKTHLKTNLTSVMWKRKRLSFMEAEVVSMKWIEAEAVKIVLEAEAIQIYRFHHFHYSTEIWGKFFIFLGMFSEIEFELKLNFKQCRTSAKWKWKWPYWKQKQVDFKTVEAEAEAEAD